MRPLALALVLALVLVPFAGLVPAADARPWAWLGVRIRDLSEQEMDDIAKKHGIREGFGVVIVEVLEGTPAASSGLKSGDIVVAFGDRPVVETRMLQGLIASAAVGQETRLTVLRPEGRQSLSVRLAAMPSVVAGDRIAAEFGFVLRDGDGREGATVGTTTPAVGVVVRGGSAERAGLQVGDVVLQVGERPVVSRDAAREALAAAGPDEPLRLTVRRAGDRVTLTLPTR